MRLNVDLIGFVEVFRSSLMFFGIHLMYDGNVGVFRWIFVMVCGLFVEVSGSDNHRASDFCLFS